MLRIPVGNKKLQYRYYLFQGPESTHCRNGSERINYFRFPVWILIVPQFLLLMGSGQLFLGPPFLGLGLGWMYLDGEGFINGENLEQKRKLITKTVQMFLTEPMQAVLSKEFGELLSCLNNLGIAIRMRTEPKLGLALAIFILREKSGNERAVAPIVLFDVSLYLYYVHTVLLIQV
ncbi:hypothetical protein SDC9_85497 [bioreactor metagenome]|uniref:Uncharacterized protein n=1 Tax=bioreactor metagenome TaxID=1076179 RepID=A0A644ZDU9_9ZZZZ